MKKSLNLNCNLNNHKEPDELQTFCFLHRLMIRSETSQVSHSQGIMLNLKTRISHCSKQVWFKRALLGETYLREPDSENFPS